jgi:collagen adhesin
MKKILTTIISLIVIAGIGMTANMFISKNSAQLNNKSYKAPSIEERRAINGTSNVTFDAYFLKNSERKSEALLGPIVGPNVNNIPTKDIYMELRVIGDGHLKDGKILIQGTNSVITTTLVTDNVINGVYVGPVNEIKLKNIQSGTTRIIKGKVQPKVPNKEYFLRNDNKIVFKATYVSADGQETAIEKVVNFTVETMYEYVKTASTAINDNQEYSYTDGQNPYAYFFVKNEGQQFINHPAYISNTLRTFEYRGQIPKFNGYNAEEVTAKFNNYRNNVNLDTTYDKNTGEFVIKYKAYNSIEITLIHVRYPKEANKDNKSEEVAINGKLTLLADNNTNYQNPLESISTSTLKAKIKYREVVKSKQYPKYIDFASTPKADNPFDKYEGNSTLPKTEDYEVRWYPYSENEITEEIELTEDKTKYGDMLLNPELNIGNIVANKGITFYIEPSKLKEDSTIKIYNDETNELIREYNKTEILENNWKLYNYNQKIKHVKIVLNNIKVNDDNRTIFKHLKEIDDDELIKLKTKEEFINLIEIKSGFQQKTNSKVVTANSVQRYVRERMPYIAPYIEEHNKIREQAAYNRIHQEEDNDFIYELSIVSTKGTKGIRVIDEKGILLLNNQNRFDQSIRTEEYIKYKGIYFDRYDNVPDNFNLKIYDNDTNELIASFTKNDIEKYKTKEKAFIYPNKIKHIRIDSNNSINMKHIMNINNGELIKNVDMQKYYNEVNYFGISPKFARIVSEGQEYKNFTEIVNSNNAYIQKSRLSGRTDKPINTYQKQKNINHEINLESIARDINGWEKVRKGGWKESTILIEYPEEIRKIEINKITTNNDNSKILGYDKYEDNGKQYLKIYIKSNKLVSGHHINVNANITTNPLAKSQSTKANVYYYNAYPAEYLQYEVETKDKFDINNNGNTNDIVGISTIPLTIVSPDTLVVTQEITGYNTKNQTTYAPGTGAIEGNGTGTATINIKLANYWTPSVSNIKLIGKIPFRNNITPLSKQELKSTFNTSITNEGIQLPADLQNVAKVYYSELEDPSIEESAVWKKADQITNWNNIKSFYIDFGNKVLSPSEIKTITYKVNVPLNTPVNEKSYSTVAAKFDLNTERDGNLHSTAESNKVGLQLLKRYNLNSSSIVKGKKDPIANTVYSIENNEEDEDLAISKTIVTDQSGNAVIRDLRVNEEYTLTERSIDNNYEEKNTKIRFKLVEQNGILELKVYEGNEYIKEKSEVQPTPTSNAIANIKIEYLKKYKLTINKKSKVTKENLKNVGYKISGRESDDNKYGSTDENGNLTFEGLRTNVIYTLTETIAPMHYIHPEIQFRVIENNGNPSIETIKGNPESFTISETNEKQNQANISIFDEKVKTYTMKIVKYEKGNVNKRLAHAQFSIKGDGMLNGKVVETDENGEATITGLYEYKEGQEYKGEYTIEEIVAPEGYTGKYKIFSKVQRDGANIARVMATTTELDIKNAETDNPTVYFFVANEPLFKIIKKDAKTSELLPNTKFSIVKVDESGIESEALDIHNNPVGVNEVINGKNYRTILTNDKGEYSAGLKKGIYKFIELKPSNDKYELSENEADRTYIVNVGEPTKAKYSFVEDKNLLKIPEVIKPYGKTRGLRRTYVNGKVIHYTLSNDTKNSKYILTIYDKEFNVQKEIKIDNDNSPEIPEINIGKDGYIYLYVPKRGLRKYNPEGQFINQVGSYFGVARYQYQGTARDMGTFGNSLFDNDTKSVPYLNPVIRNNDAYELLPELNGAKRKPSLKNGVLSIDYSNPYQVTLTVYDNQLNVLSNINVNVDRTEDNEFANSTFDQVYDDLEGNIYVNNINTNNIDVYDRSGSLQRSIPKKGKDFTVLPDGKIYFFEYKNEGKGETTVDVTATDNSGNEIAKTTLERVRFFDQFRHINVTADGSIEYSDTYNTEVVNRKIDLRLDTPAQPPKSEVVVENKLKKFKITTSSNGNGKISGEGENPYEEVEINSDSTKEIKIVGYPGYLITKITINGEEQPIPAPDGFPIRRHTATLPKLTNITENKHIYVEFDKNKTGNKVGINTYHYLKDTTTEVAPSTIQFYTENDSYTTEPQILEKYELEKNAQNEYIIPENASGSIKDIKENGKSDIVIYYYVKKKAKVITKYILEKSDGNTEEIKPKNEQTLELDSEYRTSGEINNPKYELIRIDGNARGRIESTEDINVTYVYKLKDAKVNVKYLDLTESEAGIPLSSRDGTTIADKVINGQVDDAYTTQEAENIQPNYSLVETPSNASGTMTIEPITVVYKYRKVTPAVNDINVTKVGPNKIVSKNQLNTYNITFNVDISNYIGSGKVRLTDKLPYEIHYEDTDRLAKGLFLDGGIYNNETKEIIWDIPITDINTYKQADERNENNIVITQNGNSAHITINKTISIRYKDLPNYNQGEEPKIENSIFGKLILDRNNEREVNSKYNSPANYNTAITVKKKWNDNNNLAEKRPTSITFALYKTINGQEIKVKDYTLTGNKTTNDGWEIKIEQLPIYDGVTQSREIGLERAGELGNRITYRVEETTNNKFYKSATTTPSENEFLLTNTFTVPDEKIEVQVNKVWDDNSNANGKRPVSIKYVLNGGKTPVEGIATGKPTTNNGWSHTFTNLAKYDDLGNEITYTVSEQEITTDELKFYTNRVSGEYKTGITITNKFTVPDNKVEVIATKQWMDENNSNGKRPLSIKYILTGNGTTKEQVVSGNRTTDQDWEYKFTNLPKYDTQGNEISYSVDEKEVNTGDLKFYTKSKLQNKMINTFKVPDEKINIPVTKHWEDENNANGKRPTSIKYVLTGNGTTKEQVITGNSRSDADWSYTFTNLQKYDPQGNEIAYTVEEQEVNENDLKFYAKSKVNYDLTNTFKVPNEKIEISVKKHWEDNSNANGKRPASVKYVLTGNGLTKEQIVTGNASTDDNWSYTFTDLPKYNSQGNEIVYTVDEQEANTNGLKFYQKSIRGSNIVNTFTVPDDRIEVAITKTWVDNNNANGKRPTSVKYVLSGNGLNKEEVVTGNTRTNEDWNYRFTKLPKYDAQGNEITYTVDEQEVNPGDFKFYKKQVNGNNVTNTFTVPDDKVTVQVVKTWEDNSNEHGKRPIRIKYILKGGKTEQEKEVTGNRTTNENWDYTFTNLPKYNENGEEYRYKIEEEITENAHLYKKKVSAVRINEETEKFNVVNTFAVPNEKIEVPVTKHWEDDSNANHKRPTSIKYILKGGAAPVEKVVSGNSTKDENWGYKFTNLPKYNESGDQIRYTIEEQEVNANDLKFYTKSIRGYDITNTFTVPNEKVEVQVNKTWADDNNANSKRPTSVKYVLSGNGQTQEKVVTGNVNTDQDWSYKFTELPKYNEQGNEITYTVDEQEVNTGDLKFYTKQVDGFNITNTFTVPDEKIELKVTKTWNDDSNKNGKRPVSIKYVLSGNDINKEHVVTGNSTTNEDWSYKFTDLPKYNAQGNEIVYTVAEQEATTDGLKFYTNEISGEYKTAITVKNKFTLPEDKIELEVTKHWEDNNNANHRRPTSIKYVLKGNGLTKEQEVIGNATTDAGWNYKFTNLPKYNAHGNEITYTVEEQEVNANDLKFYTKEVNGFNVTNTFKVPEDKVNVKATKTWVDSSNAKGKRPASIKYILKGGKEEKTQVVSGNNTTDENWSYTFENLAKYDSNGQEYQYNVEEEITENAHLYTKVITGSKESGFNVINTFKVPEDKLTIAVTKEWKDNSNVASKRPSSIKYVLKGGATPVEAVVSGNNATDADWNHTFTNVAKYNDSGDEITYTLEEQEVSANDFKFYKKSISGDYKAGFNVANTFEVPDEKVEVQVNKVWEDDSNANTKRPTSIKYVLKGGESDKTQVVTGNTNSNADWSYKFTNLPKYSAMGDEIQYTLEEQEVNVDDFKFYTKQVDGDYKSGFNVKNTFKVPEDKISVNVVKTWEDNSNVNGKRPASIKYVLKGGESDKTQVVTGSTTTNDNWSYTFANLPKYNAQGNEITYTVEEQEVNQNDLKFYVKSINGFNVTNTFRIPDDKVKVEITKKWEDDSNVSNKRPASIKIELSDGANVVRTQELTGTGNEWTHTFTDLPKYNSQGNTITYTLEEKEVNPGDLQFYTKSIVGNTITNTFTQSTDRINVNVSKTWNDSNNASRKRPVSIKYVLKNKETVVSEKVVAGNETTDADWTHTFTGLAKYDNHNDEIKYTLEEKEANEGELKFYTKQVNGDYKAGFNVVNTFKVPDERINVRVSKIWNDDSNSRSKRPTSIKYIITDGQNTVEQIVTGESNTDTNWSYEFSNLVKYEANTGNEISYTVREEEVNLGDLKFYETTISGDYKAGINVKNKFVVPNDKVTPRVKIIWEDNNNNGNKRPSNVKIIVKDKEGKVVKEGNVTGNPTDEEWNKVFENVPKYDKDGNPIPYTVEEKPNSPDDFKFYKITVTGDIDKGYEVTNKFEVPDEKVTVKVKKVWEDNNNAASKRPAAIKVQLKNNAAIVREERVTGSGSEWKYTFENVSKYNGYGDVINYSVEEIEDKTEDLKFYEKKITGDKDSEYVITNKFKVPDEKIDINVNKTWEDNNNSANKRPTSIKYILKGGAAEVEELVSGNRTTDANWSYKFKNVNKYDNNANEIQYTLEEQEVNDNDLKFYTKKVSGEQTNGFAVVNKFTVPNEKVTVKVSKTWDDNNNTANKRPSSIKYEVLNGNNQIVASKVQSGNKNTADGWSHNFELDKYDALGNEEVYNVQEVEVNQNDFKFYRATVSGNYKSGFTVTNKFEVPNEEVTPKISVEWKDNSNQNNKRPTSVKIQVKDEEGRIVKESPVTGLITEESWKKIFENVPKYNKNGDPINYTITEEPNNPNDLEFYTTTTSGNITNGFKVVNTYAVPGTTINLKANKKWVDGHNAKNKRPKSIKIEVRNNNEVIADKEVKGDRITDANWEVEFKNLPKYNPTTGTENVYKVTESEVNPGELMYYTSAVNGNTITNTIKPLTEGKIEDSKVEKESTLAKITKVDEIVPYTITYKGKIKEYMGDAVVKIVDELPFKLDLSKSNIMDGSYDDESKTITWTENLNNIDTHSNGDKEVEIKKEIKLVYKDLKISEENLKVRNKVRAEISLKELNKKITENNTKEIPAEISSKVTVKYVLKSNRSMKLKEDKVITGHVGDAYQTTIPNDIDPNAYEFVEVEGNENGKISQEEKVVTYLYKKKFGKVVVSYVEKSTGMKLQNDEVINGNINEPYNTEAKDIEYYNLVSTEKSENIKPVITEEEQKITYYYEKKVFNIEIDKELKEATIDGEKRTFRNGKFTKLDIPVKKILNSEVKVRYSINVKNTGEIKGSIVVQENIPKYFTMNPSENPDWRIEHGKIVSKKIELNPRESKELSITLKWTNSKDNFGTLVNKVGIEKTKNNAGFEETDTEEEKKGKKQQATLVLVPKTGLDINKLLQMTGGGITLTALLAAMGYTISRKVKDEYINN